MMFRKPVFLVNVVLLLISALFIGVPSPSWGQLSSFGVPKKQSKPAEIVTAHGVLSVDKVQPGSTFQVAIVMEFAAGWHANANPAGEGLIPTEVILPDTPAVTFGEAVYPKGEVLEIASIGKAPVYHEGAVIGVQAKLSRTAQPYPVTLPFQLRYQACTDEQCLLPKVIDVDIPIEIVGMDGTIRRINDAVFAGIQFGAPPGSDPATSESGRFSQALSKGYFWAFLFVFVGGILTSFTPCVYPLIPITVSVFGAGESVSRLRSFLLSVTYVLGIALIYSILGVAAAKTGAVFGNVMANPFVIIPICGILAALGLSMLGVFEIRLPYALQNKLNTVGGTGFAGAFAMGTVAGFIAAPCTGPVLVGVLSHVATTGSVFLGFWLLLTYALGMGLLFIVIGTFSGVISALPRSGGWMYILENVFGVVIIAVALYFLKEIIEPLRAFLRHSAGFFAIAGVLLLVGVLLGKFTQRFKDLPHLVQLRKAFGILLAVVGLYMFIGGFTTAESNLDWIADEAQGLELARREGKPVMLDFYATWCGACNELDHKTYSDSAVQSRLSQFVNVKLDFSRNSDEIKRLQEKYNIVGLPVVIFFDSKGNQLKKKRLEKFIEPKDFLALVEGID
ncbi:MAG: thioredoxin family protein [Candidatus Poribacteria bacterium]|nr:thioredoxin family protein [Candidatus Poribacteria bacterium]